MAACPIWNWAPIILGLRVKGESLAEMLGFLAAADARMHRHAAMPHGRVRPIVLPTYNGARKEANLTPLLAMLLQRFGVPVLVHGLIEGYGRVTTGQVFRELGIMPSVSILSAQARLEEQGLAFLPLSALPGRAQPARALRSAARRAEQRAQPGQDARPLLRRGVWSPPRRPIPEFLDLMRDMLLESGRHGILLRGTEGEPFASPGAGRAWNMCMTAAPTYFSKPSMTACARLPQLPDAADAASTRRGSGGCSRTQLPVPKPIANQLACCLLASGAMPTTSVRPRPSWRSRPAGDRRGRLGRPTSYWGNVAPQWSAAHRAGAAWLRSIA
jgi:anthranilate phosphoribosyltransferase